MSNDRLSELLDDIATDLMMVDSPDDPELDQVRENTSELLSSVQVLVGLEEGENDLLKEIIDLLKEAEEILADLSEQPAEDFDFSLDELSQTLEAVEPLLRDYGQGISDSDEQAETEEKKSDTESSYDEEIETASDEPMVTEPDSYDEELFFDFYSEASEHLQEFEEVALRLEQEPSDSEAIDRGFRNMHSIKGMAGFLNLRQVNRLSHAMENILDLFREGYPLQSQSIDVLLSSLDILKQLVNLHHTTVETGEGQSLPLEKIHTATRQLDEELDRVRSFSPSEEPRPEAEEPQVEDVSLKSGQQIRVDLGKIDSLVNNAGELTTAFQRLKKADEMDERDRQQLINQLDRIVTDLQESSLSLRMIPLNKSFGKLRRLVRDLSRDFDKKVEFNISGEETELDRTLVEKIQDPLVHLVRNAIDHGIEKPEVRQEQGKPETGELNVSACHESGNVVVEISDDGAGLDPDDIFETAVERGVVQAGRELEDDQIYQLIFEPGFSTNDEVTDVSGRGVGMDVVKSNLEEINGRVEVDSEPGEGTTFRLQIPLTLSIINGMLIRVGDQRFVLPTLDILESLRPDASQVTTVEKRGQVLKLRDQLIRIVRLHELFDIEPDHRRLDESLVVIASGVHEPVALQVDELLGQQEVVIKSMGEAFAALSAISGAAILADGSIGLILDSTELG